MSNTAMFRLTVMPDLPMDDDTFVADVIDRLHLHRPGVVEGYQYERTGENEILLMLWGRIEA